MVNPNVPLHELNAEIHLTESNRALLESVRCDVIAHTDIIIDHGHTGKIDDAHINEILQSIIISIVTKRLVCLKEFMDALNSYGLENILQIHPDTCKVFFVRGVQNDAVDANYLFSIIQPKFSEPGSIRKENEESMMDFLQDFLFQLEDTPNLPGNSEESSSCEDTDNACASAGNVEDMARCADANSDGKDSRAASSGNVRRVLGAMKTMELLKIQMRSGQLSQTIPLQASWDGSPGRNMSRLMENHSKVP